MDSLESFFILINDYMQEENLLTYLGSFLWGLVSVLLSPCHLASIPLLVSYMAGQRMTLTPRHATCTALLFSLGLFLSITAVGCLCSWLGWMLGDVPPIVRRLTGLLLLLLGIVTAVRRNCSIPYTPLFTFEIGAVGLGLVYGVLSGVCTFGFLAPILATITMQQKLVQGVFMTLCFGIGHCLPIVLIGSGVSFFDMHGYQRISQSLRRLAGILIIGFGLYLVFFP